jgi:hypothetical protein
MYPTKGFRQVGEGALEEPLTSGLGQVKGQGKGNLNHPSILYEY